MSVFVSANQLNEAIQQGRKHTVIAALWEPKEGKAWSKFQSEHIPTALFCDPSSQLAGLPGRKNGRNPLPPFDVVEKAVAEWGIEPGRPTVVYDGGNGLFAARLWWVLCWAGVDDVYILDGGFANWDDNGMPTVAGPGSMVVPRQIQLTQDSLPTATIDDVKAFDGLLVDTRSERRYQGRREILDLRAGHIPSALNLPVDDLFDKETHKVKDVDYIRDRFARIGITQNSNPEDAIVYSGSGNHSALLLAAMEHAGLPVLRHYVGGWSQWSADPENPIATRM